MEMEKKVLGTTRRFKQTLGSLVLIEVSTKRKFYPLLQLMGSRALQFGDAVALQAAGEEDLPLTSKLTCAEVVALVKIIRPS